MEKFLEAARALEADESEERFNAALRKIAKQKPRDPAPKKKAPAKSK